MYALLRTLGLTPGEPIPPAVLFLAVLVGVGAAAAVRAAGAGGLVPWGVLVAGVWGTLLLAARVRRGRGARRLD